ncbi:MAG TPA: tRNA (adenosine(37)-N6)-threonylcarbamoyltransferase complex dimerization subunit type 1 TsaB [Vicinamibacterales bacterium]
MTILSLDTSSASGSAAILRDGAILVERRGDAARTHGERLPRELMDLLDAAGLRLDEIDRFAVAIGPGSFTGLRIGIATVQGLALAAGKLVTPVSTFDALRISAGLSDTAIAVWIDAHRGEVFAMLYGADGRVQHEPTSLPPDATLDAWALALAPLSSVRFAGDGAVKYRDAIERRIGGAATIAPAVPPLAAVIASIADAAPDRGVRPHAVAPLYVRRSDAELARDRRRRGGA